MSAAPRSYRVVCWAVPGDPRRWAVIAEAYDENDRWDVLAVYDLRSDARDHIRTARQRQQVLLQAERGGRG